VVGQGIGMKNKHDRSSVLIPVYGITEEDGCQVLLLRGVERKGILSKKKRLQNRKTYGIIISPLAIM
jgi:hypothetical protein